MDIVAVNNTSGRPEKPNTGLCISKYPMPYDRSVVRKGIVHIGAGRFHRAHEALYCHELLAKGDLRWGISAAYLLDSDQPTVDAMPKVKPQRSLVVL
jgi:mannitol-1-phosphate/altronate dehydrogenase